MSSCERDSRLADRILGMPESPGVYLIKDSRGKIIYVGKAKNLQSRVRNYLQKPQTLDPKTAALVCAARDIDYIATESEVEALVLECTLIKENRPRYNIRLKDDKRYPFFKLTLNEPFPRLLVVRSVANDGAEYFGPFTDSSAVKRTLRALRLLFPLRDCGEKLGRIDGRECINFHIGRCNAPCTGRIDERSYRDLVEEVRLFLKGKRSELALSMRNRMMQLSREKRYEEAAIVRDQLLAFEKITLRQIAVSPEEFDADAIAVSKHGAFACGIVMKIREGAILAQEIFKLPAGRFDSEGDLLEAFIELYYHRATDVPELILVPSSIDSRNLVEDWLGKRCGKKIRVSTGRCSEERSLVELALKNARLHVETEIKSRSSSGPALRELAKVLGLAKVPRRIEAFDISNLHESEAVGAMVTFDKGVPNKSRYRHFKIGKETPKNDFAMMKEVLTRRISHIAEGKDRHPDLILVDGGAGQVSAALKALAELHVDSIPVAGLAKRNEEIYLSGSVRPLSLPRSNPALKLLQRIRNEAHRFAVSYHRSLRSRRTSSSGLDEIPGVGPKLRNRLLSIFGSLEAVREASIADIAKVPGMGKRRAKIIYEFFHASR